MANGLVRLAVVAAIVVVVAFASRPLIEVLTVASDNSAGSIATTRTLRFAAVADTYVASDHPQTNYGAADRLEVDGSQIQETYLKFDVSGVDGVVTAAAIQLHVTNASPNSGGSIAQMSDVTWSESEVTYKSRPEISGVILSTLAAVSRADVVTFDVSQADIHNGMVSFGINSRQRDEAGFASREHGDGPELILTVQSSTTNRVASASDPVLVGAGDIGSCNSKGGEETAQLLASIPGTIFTAGDNAYPNGSASDFTRCFQPSWGQFRDRIRPASGNHDYNTSDAAGYFDYFGSAAGNPDAGYYSYDLGTWHIVVINSNIARDAHSPQYAWLTQDLAAHRGAHFLAYWHHPRYSSGEHGDNDSMDPIWDLLCDARTDVVIVGHDHDYERFAPINKDGQRNNANGIREFVVGTGGASHDHSNHMDPNSQVRNFDTFGVLKLTLHADSYNWEFIPVAGQTFTDAGSSPTHD
jgi:acid phosphatase type 7